MKTSQLKYVVFYRKNRKNRGDEALINLEASTVFYRKNYTKI